MLSDEQLLDADPTGTGELVGLRAVEAAVCADMAIELQAARARADEAESILIRVVQQANTHAVDGDDGFIAAYHMPVGPVHAAIPFLQGRGIYVDEFGGVHRADPSAHDGGRALRALRAYGKGEK